MALAEQAAAVVVSLIAGASRWSRSVVL